MSLINPSEVIQVQNVAGFAMFEGWSVDDIMLIVLKMVRVIRVIYMVYRVQLYKTTL
jgi:uncharacterized ion transporter superfamily protein YfcC